MDEPTDDDLLIDKNRLEDCCGNNPLLAKSWGLALAEAKKEVSDTKRLLKLKKAELNLDIRNNPASYGVENPKGPTVDMVEALITVHPDIQRLEKELIEAEFDQDRIDAMVKSVADRKQELTNMVQLYGFMYWSKPDTSSKATETQRKNVMRDMEVGERKPGKKK